MVSLWGQLTLGLGLIYRERKGRPIKVLYWVLAFASFFLTLIHFFNDHAWSYVVREATKAYGADFVVSSSEPFAQDLKTSIQKQSNKWLEVHSTLTMARAGDALQLVSIKAVSDSYPLMGDVTIQNRQGAQEAAQIRPKEGTIWVDERVLWQMNLTLGDTLWIGDKELVVDAVLLKEPDAASGLSLLAPRVLLSIADLKASQVVVPGSRVEYALWLLATESAIQAIETQVAALNDPHLDTERVIEGNTPLQKLVQYSGRYLGLLLMLTVLLAGLSISVCARMWVQSRHLSFAIYRVLGQPSYALMVMLVAGILTWGFLVIAIAQGFAMVAAHFAIGLSQTLFVSGPFEPSFKPIWMSFCLACYVLLGFTLPEIWTTRKVSVNHLLRPTEQNKQKGVMPYSLVAAFGFFLLWYYVRDLSLCLILVAGFGWSAFLSYLLMLFVLTILQRTPKPVLSLKLAIASMRYRASEHTLSLLSLLLTLMVLVILYGIQKDFLSQWQEQLPEQTPNVFLLNIPIEEQTALQADIEKALNKPVPMYPIVRGRIVQVKDRLVEDWIGFKPNSLRRALNITYLETLPKENPIVEGEAWESASTDKLWLSVEKGFASDLSLNLGDSLSFLIAGQTLEGFVHNIREVTWQSFKPNFYVIFKPGYLESLPATTMTSFNLPEDKKQLLAHVSSQYPEVTVIDIEYLVAKIQVILSSFVKGLTALVLVVVFFGLVILYVVLNASRPSRMHQASLLKLIGGSNSTVQSTTRIEIALVVGVAVLMAIVGGVLVLNNLGTRLFDIQYRPDWWVLGIGGVCTFLLLTGFGSFSLRKIAQVSPLVLLKNEKP